MKQHKKLTFSVKTSLLVSGAAVSAASLLGCGFLVATNPAPVDCCVNPAPVWDMSRPDQGAADMPPDLNNPTVNPGPVDMGQRDQGVEGDLGAEDMSAEDMRVEDFGGPTVNPGPVDMGDRLDMDADLSAPDQG